MRARLRESIDEQPESHSLGRRKRKHGKKVHYQEHDELYSEKEASGATGLIKRPEDIPIPEVANRTISKAEKLLAIIMAPNDAPSRMHGLHGTKLMYEAEQSMATNRSMLTIAADCSQVSLSH